MPAPDSPEEIRYGLRRTSVASILVAESATGVVAILMQEGSDPVGLVGQLERHLPKAHLVLDEAGVADTVATVVEFIEDPNANLDLPLDIRTTPFQRRVYDEILTIPFGQTSTFAVIAARIGSPKAVRAVGNACSRNPLEWAIPCHRVLRSDGSWSGGSEWGDRRQATVVTREAVAVAQRNRSG